MFKNIAIVVIIALGLAAGYKLSHPPALQDQGMMHMAGAAPVDVATSISKEIVEWDEFSGRLTAIERVEIRPRVEGTIEAVLFEEGQIVQKGQGLFTIDPRPYQAALNKADADLNAARAQLAYATLQNKRATKLLSGKAIAQREFDETNNAFKIAKASVAAAEAAVEIARLNMSYTQIVSPIAGRISRAEITAGNLVKSGGDAPVLTTVVSVDPIYAEFDADEQSFVKYLRLNEKNPDNLKSTPVLLGLAGSSQTPFEGRIQSFDNALNAKSGTIRVRAVFDNKDGLMIPGLFARVQLGGGGKKTVVMIHEQAIGTDQNKKFVYVVGSDNKANYREIKLGSTKDGLRVVVDGLKEGEKIVVGGLQRVRPGAEISPNMVSMETLAAPVPNATAPATSPKAEMKTEPTPPANAETKTEPVPEAKTETKAEAIPETQPPLEAKPALKEEIKTEIKSEPAPEAKVELKPEPEPVPISTQTPVDSTTKQPAEQK